MRYAVAVTAAAAIVVVNGCAGIRSGDASPEAVQSADTAAAARLLDDLKRQIFGTGAQRTAGDVRMWRQIQGAIAGCMESLGWRYAQPEHVDITVPPEDMAVGDLTAFAPMRDRAWGIADRQAKLAQAGEPTNLEFAKIKPEARADYTSALMGCQEAGATFVDSGAAPGHLELAVGREEVLLAIENSDELAPLMNDYAECLKSNGMSATTWSELRQQAERAFPPVQRRLTSPPPLTRRQERLDVCINRG